MGLRERLGRRGRGEGATAAELSRGGAVTVDCRLRRTSARGWGAWTPAQLHLGPVPDGDARWSTDDAVAVGFASTNERIDLPFEEVSDVYRRAVRFRTEAFWGMEADIVVVASDRGTIEVAVPPADAEAVAMRLTDLLLRRALGGS
jgi:broad specificity phosphatase PhoE